MSNTALWICLTISLLGNAVFGYLFWRAIKQNGNFESELIRLGAENHCLKVANTALHEINNKG